ncbi:MAG TPA: HAMP domain-containing sensor histidine kinase [Polyangiaceae bacterium]
MNQAISGKTRRRLGDKDVDSAPDDRPLSTVHARVRPEASLLELALRLTVVATVDEAIGDAVATLSSLLPECEVIVVEPPAGAPEPTSTHGPASAPPSHRAAIGTTRARGSGRCDWPLTQLAGGHTLVINLGSMHRPREVARVLELGERVAGLLSTTLRRHALELELASKDQEIVSLRERVIQAEKLAGYGQFAACVLHDLNNPLTAILAYSEYLSRALDSTQIASVDVERIARIRDSAITMLNQTRTLVEYARPSRAPTTAVDLPSVVNRAIALCDHELTRANIGVSVMAEALEPVCGHFEQLTQLFVNLFTNAAHAARKNGAKLSVHAMRVQDSEWITVEVQDNGSGIQDGDIGRVFDPFYTTKGGSGTGLGLSIVRDIVRQHGGEISVQSTPDVETTFRLTFRAMSQAERG